jgi:amidase
MTPTDLHYLSLIDVGRLIQSRALSSVEVTRAMLERIDGLDGRLGSYATLTPERALEAAAEADREIARGSIRGPLHGVPVAVKDLCNTQGVRTMAGMTIYKDFVPERDATVVARLKTAGAVLLGKTQLTEGALSAHHPAIKAPLNPWSAAHWPGVSSSGSGVATAAGLCYAALGSDTLGSIRFPSTMNGVTGLKPTWGRVSRAGVFALADTLDHIGPMARSAADAAAVLGAIAGSDPEDPTALQDAVPDYLAGIDGGVRGVRIGIDRPLLAACAEADMARITEEAATVFAQLGAEVRDVRVPSLDQITRDAAQLCSVETALAHAATYPARASEYGPVLAAHIDAGRQMNGMAMGGIVQRREVFRGALAALFGEIDLLLLPAMNVAAPSLAWMAAAAGDPEARFARIRFTAPLDMSGSPSLTLPGGATAAGLPLGFQIVGRHLDEALILRAGHAYQQATEWHTRRPELAANS